MGNKKFITVHSKSAMENKNWVGITWVVCNIPIKNKDKVIELFGSSENHYIQYHNYRY